MNKVIIMGVFVSLLLTNTAYAKLYETDVERTWRMGNAAYNTVGDGLIDYGNRRGWVKEEDKWYYLDNRGIAISHVLKKDGNVYYFKADGEWLEPNTQEYINYTSLLEQLDVAIKSRVKEFKLYVDGYQLQDYANIVDSYMTMYVEDVCRDSRVMGITIENSGITFKYTGQSDILDGIETVKENLDKLVEMLKQIDGDTNKVKVINDKLVDTLSYDDSLKNTENDLLRAYLNKNKVVCIGYATIFKDICDRVGLESYIITGYTQYGYHAWNSVRVEGQLKYMDVCWNDTSGTREKYLLVSKEFIGLDHKELLTPIRALY